MKKTYILLWIILTPLLFADPQCQLEVQEYHIAQCQYWKQALRDAKEVVIAPACWDKQDITIVALVVAGTMGLMTIDLPISQAFREKNIGSLHGILAIAENFGDKNRLYPALVGTYAIGEILDNRKVRKIALLSIESCLLTGGFVEIGKYLTHRKRPRSESPNPYIFDGPSLKGSHKSFPSGHSGYAFAVAAVISEEFKDESILIPITAYTLASLTALSRIEHRAHWPSDVFFGACLGLAIGRFIAKLHCENPINEDWGVNVLPHTSGLQITLGRSF